MSSSVKWRDIVRMCDVSGPGPGGGRYGLAFSDGTELHMLNFHMLAPLNFLECDHETNGNIKTFSFTKMLQSTKVSST
jgi:hypothetical protein